VKGETLKKKAKTGKKKRKGGERRHPLFKTLRRGTVYAVFNTSIQQIERFK
jgi:hypothetical protein